MKKNLLTRIFRSVVRPSVARVLNVRDKTRKRSIRGLGQRCEFTYFRQVDTASKKKREGKQKDTYQCGGFAQATPVKCYAWWNVLTWILFVSSFPIFPLPLSVRSSG